MAIGVQAQDSAPDLRKDSLLQVVNHTEGAEKLEAYQLLINHLSLSADADTTLRYLPLYEQEALKQDQPLIAGRVRGSISPILFNHGRYEELAARTPDDLAFIATTKAWNAYFKSYWLLVESYMHAGQPALSLEAAARCYEESKSIDAPEARVWPLYILGVSCMRNDRLEECVAYYLQCLREAGTDEACLEVKLQTYTDLLRTYKNLKNQAEQGRLLPVWEADIRRAEATGKYNMTAHWANFYIVCINYYSGLKDGDELEKYIQLAARSTSAQILGVRLAVLRGQQSLAFMRGRYQEAIDYIEQRHAIYTEMGTFEGRMETFLKKAHALAFLAKGDESIEAVEQALAMKDSITNLDIQAQLDELRITHEVDTLAAEKERTRNYLLFALGGCALLALALGIWIYYSRQIARKNRTLARQIRELTEQQEQRDQEMLSRTTFIPSPEEAAAHPDDDGFCPDTRKDRLCIAIRDLLLKDKAYRNPVLTRDYMVDHLGTSKELFSDAFQYCFGMPFNDYINSLRLKDAVRLLEQSDLPVQAISEKVGFGTIRTFQRQFQARYNMSPMDYRSQRKSDDN